LDVAKQEDRLEFVVGNIEEQFVLFFDQQTIRRPCEEWSLVQSGGGRPRNHPLRPGRPAWGIRL
jgi:hypothetical protein